MISVFDLFTIGIGPSSSHTVGPMRAARMFAVGLADDGLLKDVAAVRIDLYGSLAATGRGHGTDRAVLVGLEGETPEGCDPARIPERVEEIRAHGTLCLLGDHEVGYAEEEHLGFRKRETLPGHPNGVVFPALRADRTELRQRTYYSVGGGFVVDEAASGADRIVADRKPVPHPFGSGDELLALTKATGLPISGVVLENELVRRSQAEIREGLLKIWAAMQACVERGCDAEGILPGGLKVNRRAKAVHAQLSAAGDTDPLHVMDWIGLYALAVNEENAAGGRVVTAPTNGAAGIIPAVLHYYWRFVPGADEDGVVRFLLTAGAIGLIFKNLASISGAEVGCQGEVGSACSMAAGALCEVLGGTPEQVENAAEIGMEHNLGLTCDPIGGLVQVPCIERNAIAAVKAITAARMALHGDGTHFVSLDKVVKTMRDTGADMKDKYKETARGGLAVNVIEC